MGQQWTKNDRQDLIYDLGHKPQVLTAHIALDAMYSKPLDKSQTQIT